MHSAPRRPASATRLLAGALLVWGAAPAAAQASPPPDSAQRFGTVPPFRFVERSGEALTLDDLRGAPWVGVPFFVRCTGPCPSLTTDLRTRLYEALEGTGARIVSFSVDPELDTPEKLREYADQFGIDSERWLFVTGEEQAVHRFLREGLKVPVARAPEEAAVEVGQSLTHGTRLPVVDAQGRIAGWYECARGALGDDPEALEAQFELVRERVLALAGGRARGGSRSALPLVNATLNGIATVLLLAGWTAIRRGRRERHARLMKSAFVTSAAFLACYLYYHFVVQREAGPTRYHGTGWRKGAYLALLASHVVLAMVNLPMVLRTLWLARRQDWERHRRLARRTFPIWLYVSVTGVLVYLVLYPWNPPPPA